MTGFVASKRTGWRRPRRQPLEHDRHTGSRACGAVWCGSLGRARSAAAAMVGKNSKSAGRDRAGDRWNVTDTLGLVPVVPCGAVRWVGRALRRRRLPSCLPW